MIYLHTLGDALIKVGEKEIRPTAPLLFAALLYLGMERGRRVPRTALQELLFPDADERSGAHSLRQLLYKLRQLGAPLEVDGSAVALTDVSIDAADWRAEDLRSNASLLKRVSFGLLPGYQPTVSPEFERWLDDVRSTSTARTRSALIGELARARRGGDQLAVQHVATALLRLDPLNEEATLSQAEALALSGQKHDAIRVLEKYSAEVGERLPNLRLAPETLRRRIVDRVSDEGRASIPMLGRQEELSWLLAQFARVLAGSPTVTIVWGDAGIGKTRLVNEYSAYVRLQNVRVMSAQCQPHDVDRPLGALVDLVPRLLEARGALGVAPVSLENLRGFVERSPNAAKKEQLLDPELITARLRSAVTDLLHCVAAEGPLILIVEDAHWLDEASLRLLLTTVLARNVHLQLLFTFRYRPRIPQNAQVPEHVFIRRLEPLDASTAAELLSYAVGQDVVLDSSVRDQCLAVGAGNPLLLCTVAEHLRLHGAAPSGDASIVDLLKERIRILAPESLLMLRCIAALGTHGAPARVATCSGVASSTELLALQELADQGLVVRQQGLLRCSHDLLTEAVLSDCPKAMRLALYERVATVLERDGIDGKQVNLLWSCAESWRLAENTERATRMLQHCADFAVEMGQPTFAGSALEKAQEICDDGELAALLEKTIRVSELAGDHQSVLRNVHRYRANLGRLGKSVAPHHHSELAEIHALRQSGESVWHFIDGLRECVLDLSAPTSHRYRAMGLFIVITILHLERSKTVALYSQLGDLTSDMLDPIEASRLRMLFNVFFGDMQQACADAEHLLQSVKMREETLRAFMYGDIAGVLFYSGKVDLSIDVLVESTRLNEKLGSLTLLGFDCCRLASFYGYLGDWGRAQSWIERAELLPRTGDLAACHLSNRLAFALQAGDLQAARADLEILRSHPAAKLPHSIRTVRGMEILLAAAEGSLEPDRFDLRELEDLDDRGRDACEHHVFALALFNVYLAAGRREAGIRRMREYVCVRRRERYSLWPFFNSLGNPLIADALEDAIGQSSGTNVATVA